MHIAFFIGNGFDLAHNAKTRYSDFLETYKKKSPVNKVAEQMIKEINNDVQTWADMERRLGLFTEKVSSVADFEIFYYDLLDSMRSYLSKEDGRIAVTEEEKILSDIWRPEKYLNPLEQHGFQQFMDSFAHTAIYSYVISFNYTNILERMMGYKGQKIQLKNRYINAPYQISEVYKIHGALNGTPILGVNDTSQITNKTFANDVDVCDYLVKPQSNTVLGTLVDTHCRNIISEANLFILHGLSLGDTDKTWWQLIGNRLTQVPNTCVIYFLHSPRTFTQINATKIASAKRQAQDYLCSRCDISDKLRDNVKKRIYVSINSDFMV